MSKIGIRRAVNINCCLSSAMWFGLGCLTLSNLNYGHIIAWAMVGSGALGKSILFSVSHRHSSISKV